MYSVLVYSAPNQIIERTTRTGTGENEGEMFWRRTEGYGLERRKDIWIGEKEEKGIRVKERNMNWREGRGGIGEEKRK
jgi:hypothetical protein